MKPEVSILVTSPEDEKLFRRALWALAMRPPQRPFELVVADDREGGEIEGLLRSFGSMIPWKLVRCDGKLFNEQSGVEPNRAWLNNVAWKHAGGDWLALQGGDVIAWGDVYERLLSGKGNFSFLTPTVYNLLDRLVSLLDENGQNLTAKMVEHCAGKILASPDLHSEENYLSLTSRELWVATGGFDECCANGFEFKDWLRRCRNLPGWAEYRSEALVLRQERLSVATETAWSSDPVREQTWPAGTLGVIEVLENGGRHV